MNDDRATAKATNFEDELLQCKECKQDFIFTAGEQEFFSKKGFTPPKRCKECRLLNKERKEQKGSDRPQRR